MHTHNWTNVVAAFAQTEILALGRNQTEFQNVAYRRDLEELSSGEIDPDWTKNAPAIGQPYVRRVGYTRK